MELEAENVVYTCGICEMIVEEYVNHPCLEGFTNMFMDDNHYFYPLLDDQKTVVRRSQLPNGTENVVAEELEEQQNKENDNPNQRRSANQVTKRNQSQLNKNVLPPKRGQKSDDLEIELMILEVEKRAPSWNFSIPIEESSRERTAILWEQVSTAIGGKLSATDVKEKFKTLKDMYWKIVQAEHHPSGAARVEQKEKWKFYRQMEFLRDSCLIRPTASNISQPIRVTGDEEENTRDEFLDSGPSLDDDTDDLSSQVSGMANTRARRRSAKEADDATSTSNRIADAMCREEPPLVLPSPPKLDDVDGFLIGIGSQLRRLPNDVRLETIIEILNLIRQKRQAFAVRQ